MLTELEGAILTEIGFRQRHTAFKVRQAFKASPSRDWQGSAGSVYPAIKRMIVKGYVAASDAHDARGTQRLSLTPDGRQILLEWFCDAPASLSIGADPFACRGDYGGCWMPMPKSPMLNS